LDRTCGPPLRASLRDGERLHRIGCPAEARAVEALAVTGATRWYSLRDVPTVVEQGYPRFISETFNAMKRPDAIEAARRFGYKIVAGTPQQMANRLIASIQGVKEPVAKAGIKPNN
jgi:tripartite-type tricarboxylate transporter receptor subunit TctC